jgi:hypothetical protein
MALKPADFQRVGLLAILAQFARNPNVDVATQMAIKESLLRVLNDHPVNDPVEQQVKLLIS